MPNIQHREPGIVGGGPPRRAAMIVPMNSTPFALQPAGAPNRCAARRQRIAMVKFVALPGEPPAPARPSWFTQVITRVLGVLAVARR